VQTVKQTLASVIVALTLMVASCGSDDEASPAQLIEAMCARMDACRMTDSTTGLCRKAFQAGCPAGQSWDGKVAQRCVQALPTADCAGLTVNGKPQLPEACQPLCH
jgi:hypothetical protein